MYENLFFLGYKLKSWTREDNVAFMINKCKRQYLDEQDKKRVVKFMVGNWIELEKKEGEKKGKRKK